MSNILILVAHPNLDASRVCGGFVSALCAEKKYTVHELYKAYPTREIDIAAEQSLLLAHDIVVLLFPVYWYSSPSLLKEWQDVVLSYNFAFGPEGNALLGKKLILCCTNGGAATDYSAEGRNKHSLETFLLPFEATFNYCKMQYAPPFVVYGTNNLSDEGVREKAQEFSALLATMV